MARMEPGANPEAVSVKFDKKDPRSSFLKLHTATNGELDSFISWYFIRSRNRKIWSVLFRSIAVAAGTFGALSLYPLTLLNLANGAEALKLAGVLAILAGGALAWDWAFSVTRKYTNWMAFAYELGVDKATFNVAFLRFYMDSAEDELTQEAFGEARKLAQETVKEFKEKRRDETKEWANNLQSVMESLRKSNRQLTADLKTASVKAVEKQEKVAEEAREKKVKAGLTIKILVDKDRGTEPLSCSIKNAETGQEEPSLQTKPGQSVSAFYAKGRYTATLRKGDTTIASAAVTLEGDQSISL